MSKEYTTIGGTPQPRRRVGRGRAAVAASIFAAGSLAGWTASDFGTSRAADATANPPTVERLADGAAGSYAGIVDQVIPAVVTIRSERTVRTTGPQVPNNPFFREFFGNRGIDPVPERRGGMGSGVIVRQDGYILTNEHVVDGADEVTVELSDGRSLDAKVVGTDRASDLAVLKVDASNLRTLTLGDSDRVRVGDVVLAVGNPLGVGQTVTMGIVSAKGRATGMGDGSYEDFIQTDAPINRGNSGGALVSTGGELIGINSQIVSPSGGNIGIGFAIPANMARNVMSQLIDHGEVRRGRLGVTIQGLTPDLASGLGLSNVRGALVSDVERGGPAAAAGLRRGDVITAINGDAVSDSNELRNRIAATAPGGEVKLTVLRDGKELTVTAKLTELSASRDVRPSSGRGPEGTGGRFGLSVEPLTPDTARERGVSTTAGVLIVEVAAGSRAADAGLRAGDVIEQVDRQPVTSVEDLRAALGRGDKPAVLLVHRGASTVFVTMTR